MMSWTMTRAIHILHYVTLYDTPLSSTDKVKVGLPKAASHTALAQFDPNTSVYGPLWTLVTKDIGTTITE